MRRALLPAALALSAGAHAADPVALPSATGQTGLVSMPDARLAPDGTWRTGMSYLKPYQSLWSSLTALPWLEGSFRYTRIMYVPGFSGTPENPTYGAGYGDFKDKSFDVKLRAFPERGWMPQIAIGAQDLFGTEVFRAYYAVASKKIHDFDFTLGYGSDRIDGAFGGVRWSPEAWKNWSLVAEYDAFNYAQDYGAQQSGAAAYSKGLAAGIEYRSDWWGAKAYAAHGEAGVNAWISVPLEAKEFVPKVNEPPAYTRINPRPTEAQWAADPAHRLHLERALHAQDFRDIRVTYENGRLEATLSNTRIASMPRAVGRAARTLLSFAPLEVREIRVNYVQASQPIATYEFADVRLLQRYFNGMATRQALAQTVSIGYAKPLEDSQQQEADKAETLAAFEEPLPGTLLVGIDAPQLFQLRKDDLFGGIGRIRPSVSGFFNDPSGAFKYDISLLGTWDRALGRHTFFNSELKLTVYETVSEVTQASNSTLPHVRTDVAEYKRGNDFKLMRALLQHYYQPAQRVYARGSAGFYEEMYAGAGGQALYLSRDGGWSADLAVDALRQRDFEGWFGFRDYSTVTAIASLNYRMSQGVTATLRAGRFLARDEGVRMELKRRFNSGFEVGAWYTVTNGNDITSPGTPDSPYYDKGIFMQVALNTLLTKDTRATANFSLAPWTRDVGQMVQSPGDLARIYERQVRELREADGLRYFGDMEDDYDLPSLGTGPRDRVWPDFVAEDTAGMGRATGKVDWVDAAVLGTALLAGSTLLDQPGYDWSVKHADKDWMKTLVKWGDALPVAAMGLSAVFAFDESRPRLSDAGTAALEAGVAALAGSEVLKYGLGRARPTTGEGRGSFEPGTSDDAFHSMPSNHVAVMWAAMTPYAKEFDAPWLYGVAGLTNLARVGSGKHWVSDTVAGSLLGYAMGSLAWEARRASRLGKNAPKLGVAPDRVTVSWDW
jgi:membrane-associated phospholipid phosphatase